MKRRILVFLPTLGSHFRGGTPSMATDLARALREMGHEPEIARFAKSGAVFPHGQRHETDGIAFTRFDSFHAGFIGFHNLPRGGAWRRYLAGFDAAIAVCGSPYSALTLLEGNNAPPLAVWAAVTMREDLKGRLEQFSTLKKAAYRVVMPLIEQQEKRVLKRCRHFWALSEDTMRHFRAMAPTSSAPMSILFSPVDTTLFSPASAPSPPPPTVVFTARYGDPRKNTLFLIEAFARVIGEVPEARLVLIGDDNPPEALRKAVREKKLENAVELRSSMKRSDLPNELRAARMFALPSHQEGLCIAALEAMACGLPIVSTRCGGPESYVSDDVTGFLVNLGDVDTMARRLIGILSNDALHEKLSAGARRFVEQHCAPEAFRANVSAVLDSILESNAKHR